MLFRSQAAGLGGARAPLIAAPGAIVLSGKAANFIWIHKAKLVADPGALFLNGRAANLIWQRATPGTENAYADPSLQLQKAIVAALKAGETGDLVGGRIYDAVPGGAIKPYVSFGTFVGLPEHGDCLNGGEMTITLDGWAAGPDTVQIKAIGAAIAADLDLAELELDAPQRLIEMTVEQTQYLRDADGITAHAIVTVHAFTEPAPFVPGPPRTTRAYADPGLQLQKAIVARLKAHSGVDAIIAGRIYDAVPGSAVKPYVSFGAFQLLPEHGDCLYGGEAFVTLDGWATGPDTVQVKQLGTAMANALDEAVLILDAPQRLVEMTVEQTEYMRDPDGITAHAAITVHAWTEPTN